MGGPQVRISYVLKPNPFNLALVFLACPTPILSHLISINSGDFRGPLRNNKDTPITYLGKSEDLRGGLLGTRDKDQTCSLLNYNNEEGKRPGSIYSFNKD